MVPLISGPHRIEHLLRSLINRFYLTMLWNLIAQRARCANCEQGQSAKRRTVSPSQNEENANNISARLKMNWQAVVDRVAGLWENVFGEGSVLLSAAGESTLCH